MALTGRPVGSVWRLLVMPAQGLLLVAFASLAAVASSEEVECPVQDQLVAAHELLINEAFVASSAIYKELAPAIPPDAPSSCRAQIFDRLGDCAESDFKHAEAEEWFKKASVVLEAEDETCSAQGGGAGCSAAWLACAELCDRPDPKEVTNKHGKMVRTRTHLGEAVSQGFNLPPSRSLQTVRDVAAARVALDTDGAFLMPAGTVDPEVCGSMATWLESWDEMLLPYRVQRSYNRTNALLTPDDAPEVATLLSAMITAVGAETWPEASLMELAAFVVLPGAENQLLHADQTHSGQVSCQLILHDVDREAGGLAVWVGSHEASSKQLELAKHLEATGRLPSGFGATEVAPLGPGAMVCYDGRSWHRGVAHTASGAPPRRVLYFTGHKPKSADDDAPAGMGFASALHPSLWDPPRRLAELV